MIRARALFAAVFVFGGFTSMDIPTVWAQSRQDGSAGQSTPNPALAAGTVVRYRVGYIHSETGSTPRSASVVTVTNEAGTPCTVSVDWRKGFSTTGLGGVICTTTFANLGRGQSADLCSRSLPEQVTVCNAVCSPELVFDEGNAVVGSTNTAACAKITVSARTYYFGDTDTAISGIDNPKITKFAAGSVGD